MTCEQGPITLGTDPLALLLESMSDAVNVWRSDGALLYRNRASLALGTLMSSSAPAGLTESASVTETLDVKGQQFERRCLRCRVHGAPYVLEVIRELARTQAEAERVWPDNSADERLVTMAHELRGRLHVLTLSSDGLLSAAHDVGTELPRAWLLERLHRLDRALHSMRELMERLLEVQREQWADAPRPQVDLRALVQELLDSDDEALRSARCPYALNAPNAVTGAWDVLQLRVAIGNLISNAAKFGAGRPIAIEVGARDAHAFVRIIDQGKGVAPEDCERIFQRFERARGGVHGKGWGLGLWLVRNIARSHGGDVTVDSAPGQGATFTFTLSLPQQREP